MVDALKVMSEVFKSPHHLVCAESSLVFATNMMPAEERSEQEPPGWSRRDDRWTIDELLGVYNATTQRIRIFTQGVDFVADTLSVPADFVEYIVRIHEYGHAVFHLGVDSATSTALAKAFVEGRPHLQRDTVLALTAAYASVDSFVHEQIAQLITWLALEELYARASLDGAKTACDKLRETFQKLSTRQPSAYRLDSLHHLDAAERRKRLRAIIALVRTGDLRATPHAWGTLMSW